MVYYSLANQEISDAIGSLLKISEEPSSLLRLEGLTMLPTIVSALAVYVSTNIDYLLILMIIFSQNDTEEGE